MNFFTPIISCAVCRIQVAHVEVHVLVISNRVVGSRVKCNTRGFNRANVLKCGGGGNGANQQSISLTSMYLTFLPFSIRHQPITHLKSSAILCTLYSVFYLPCSYISQSQSCSHILLVGFAQHLHRIHVLFIITYSKVVKQISLWPYAWSMRY